MAIAANVSQIRLATRVNGFAQGRLSPLFHGAQQRDVFGKQLDLRAATHARFFSNNGLSVSPSVADFHSRLTSDIGLRNSVQSALAGYDIRIQDAPEEFWVLVAESYAKSLVDITGQPDGHIIHLGRDCYTRHEGINSIIAYTLLKTGITDNGGGIINHGVTDGGSMKLFGTLDRAQNGEGSGHWLFNTVSHLAVKPTLKGGKMGINGEVMCTDVLMRRIFDVLIKGDFLPLQNVENPEQRVTNIGNMVPYYTGIAADIIKARTDVNPNTPINKLLDSSSVKVAISVDQNPLMQRMADVIAGLGAQFTQIDQGREISEPTKSRDPQEKETAEDLMLWLNAQGASSKNTVIPFLDADGDRIGFVAMDENGHATVIKGTDLFLLAAHNLATYNPQGLPIAVVADMRATMAALKLGDGLNSQGFPISIYPASPGYNAIHEAMAEHDAAIGVEETSHTMFTPFTSALFGAPEHLRSSQGGDNSALFGIYLIAILAHMSHGRSMAEQLAYIRAQYGVPDTIKTEYKPKLTQEKGMAKVEIARQINIISAEAFGNNPNFEVRPIDTGVSLYSKEHNAAVLIRHSKSGPSFTINTEVISGDAAAQAYMATLGVAIMMRARDMAREALSDSSHPYHMLHDFVLDLNDSQGIANEIADPILLINQAAGK
jgi:phosphomannomutase